jgi:hypothetical protein
MTWFAEIKKIKITFRVTLDDPVIDGSIHGYGDITFPVPGIQSRVFCYDTWLSRVTVDP